MAGVPIDSIDDMKVLLRHIRPAEPSFLAWKGLRGWYYITTQNHVVYFAKGMNRYPAAGFTFSALDAETDQYWFSKIHRRRCSRVAARYAIQRHLVRKEHRTTV